MRDSAAKRFDELSRFHMDRARAYVRRRLGRLLRKRLSSDDVLQEAFLEAAEAFERRKVPPGADGDGFFPWLKKVIENRIRKLARFHVKAERRTLTREVPLQAEEAPDHAAAAGATPSGLLMALERADLVEKALSCLSPKQRELIRLVYFDRLSLGEAAERLGKTPGSTAVLHCRALRRLGRGLREEEIDP